MIYYIAFSIHHTRAFVTANISSFADLTKVPGFTKAESRRPDYNEETDGIKLHWDRLLSKKGEPLRSPQVILARFKELEDQGWVVNKERFVRRHWAPKTTV